METPKARGRPPRILAAFVAVLMLWALAVGCASSRGSTYRSGSQDENTAAAASAKAAEARKAEAAKTKEPSRPRPPTPAPTPPPPQYTQAFGTPRQQTGYWSPLPPPPPLPSIGTVVISGIARDSRVEIDGIPYAAIPSSIVPLVMRLPAGSHLLHLSRFGFADQSETFDLSEDGIYRYEASYRAIGFALRSIEASPRRFDPSDPGFLGSSSLELAFVSPGTFVLEIRDDSGRIVRSLPEITVTQPTWSWRWDGRDGFGRPLPEGIYTLSAGSPDGQAAGAPEYKPASEGTPIITKGATPASGDNPAAVRADRPAGASPMTAAIEISRGHSAAPLASLSSGMGGLLYVPSAQSLASGHPEFTVGMIGHLDPGSASAVSGRLISLAGLRLGVPMDGLDETRSLELDFSVAGIFHPGAKEAVSSDSYATSLSVELPLTGGGGQSLAAAIIGTWTYGSFITAGDWPSPWDGPTRFPGLSLTLPVEWSDGLIRALIAPELEVSAFYPSYVPARVPGFYAWGYLRGGVEAPLGDFRLGLSAALRSTTFDQAFRLALPVEAGFELRWHAREIPLALGFIASMEFESMSAWSVGSGLLVQTRL
ncbi:MAG: FlgD immunoglobulin-like domain containing protein [Rectinemataceae bacterium]